MLILLPPSETKTRPETTTDTVAETLGDLSWPRLAGARETMLRAARRTALGRDAAAHLGTPASEPWLLERMAHLDEEPVAPALQVYSGVLHGQLDGAAPSPDRRVVTQSALLGVVEAGRDRIPAYRLSATSRVHRLGRAGSWWRPRLEPVARELLAETALEASPLVVDCRSGAYRSMMPVPSTPTVPVLEVTAVQERDGRRKVVSHDAKRYRGWVARVLLEQRTPLAGPGDLVDLLRTAFAGTLGVELEGSVLTVVDRV